MLHIVDTRMAPIEARRAKKGKNFNADEERGLCRSILVVAGLCVWEWAMQHTVLGANHIPFQPDQVARESCSTS